jgi:mycobactin peptide synthetase MbtE
MLTTATSALSWPQQVLALAERMRPGSVLDPRCAVHRAYRFTAEPDVALLGRVLSAVVARQDAVRTVPVVEGDGLRLLSRAPVPVEVDVQALPDGSTEASQRAAITTAACAPYDLDAGPLLRGSWLRGSEAGGVLVLSLHHWAGDGGALDALQREIATLYPALAHDRPPPAPPPGYAETARRERAAPLAEASAAWWRAELSGARRAALPPTGPGRTPGGATALVSTPLHPDCHAALIALAVEHRASPYMVLLAALGGLLEGGRSEAGDADLTVFAVRDGRRLRTRQLLGFLAEPVPLRLRLDRRESLGAAVHHARDAVLGALSHGDVPFLQLLSSAPRLAVTLLRGRRPATLVQYLAPSDLDLDGLRGTPLPTFQAAVPGEAHPAVLPIDLDITFERCGDEHHAAVLYDPGLWRRSDIETALAAVQRVLRLGVADPARPLADLAGAL